MIDKFLAHIRATAASFVPSEDGAFFRFSAAAPPPTYAGTITVTTRRSHDEIGPELIAFQVTGWSGFDTPGPTAGGFDARIHDIDYFWNFGDSGSTFTTGRLLSHMQDANVAYGADVAHVFEAGTYNVSCLAVERSSGIAALYEASFTVKDPDTEFSGTQTLYVSTAADYSTKPTGAVEYTNFVTAMAAVKSLASGSKRRVMLKRGETHTLSSAIDGNGTWPSSIYICAEPGAGAKPIINFTATGTLTGVIDRMRIMDRPTSSDKIAMTWDGIDVRGPWDPTTESGLSAGTSTGYGFLNANEDNPSRALPEGLPEYTLVTNCDIKGFGTPFWCSRSDRLPMRGIHNTTVRDWNDYAIFGDSGFGGLYLLGADLGQNPDALNGATTSAPGVHNRHGPVRISSGIFVMDGCDLFSATGWFPNVPGYNTIQPCLRLFFGQALVTPDDRANIRRSIFEGGFSVIGIGDQDGGGGPKTINAVLAQNYIIASHMTFDHILCQWRGTTIENNIFTVPNTPAISGYGFQRAVTIRVAGDAGSATERIAVRHNTLVGLKTTANGGASHSMMDTEASFSAPEAVESNSVVHYPALDTPNTPRAPLTIANTITPKTKGYRRRREVFTGTIPGGGVANGDSFTIAYSAGSFWSESPGSSTTYETTEATANHFGLVGSANLWAWVSVCTPNNECPFDVTFGASEITVTNTSGTAWSAGAPYRFEFERTVANLPPVLTQYATPAENLGNVTPETGSSAIGAATGLAPGTHLLGDRRAILDPLDRTAATLGAIDVALES